MKKEEVKSAEQQAQAKMNALLTAGGGRLFPLSEREIIFNAMDIYASQFKTVEQEPVGKEDVKDWVKRYADLRSHSNMNDAILQIVSEVKAATQQDKAGEDKISAISDAFDAGRNYEYEKHLGAIPQLLPDKEKYLKSVLKN